MRGFEGVPTTLLFCVPAEAKATEGEEDREDPKTLPACEGWGPGSTPASASNPASGGERGVWALPYPAQAVARRQQQLGCLFRLAAARSSRSRYGAGGAAVAAVAVARRRCACNCASMEVHLQADPRRACSSKSVQSAHTARLFHTPAGMPADATISNQGFCPAKANSCEHAKKKNAKELPHFHGMH